MKPDTFNDDVDQSAVLDTAKFPFECENCGYKPTPKEVMETNGDCPACGDTVIAFTVDTAEHIQNIRAHYNALKASHAALLSVAKDCRESLSRLPDVDGAFRVTCIQQAEAAIAQAEALEK